MPLVCWLPKVFTPGKSIFDVPSNGSPPIFLGVFNFVAVAANPEVFWLPAEFTPGKFIFDVPSNGSPPIVLGVFNFVAFKA